MTLTTITGPWCIGITSATHAEDTGLKSKCVHLTAAAVLCKRTCAVCILAMRENHCIAPESDPGHIDGNDVIYHQNSDADTVPMLRSLLCKGLPKPVGEHVQLGVQWITASVRSHTERL